MSYITYKYIEDAAEAVIKRSYNDIPQQICILGKRRQTLPKMIKKIMESSIFVYFAPQRMLKSVVNNSCIWCLPDDPVYLCGPQFNMAWCDVTLIGSESWDALLCCTRLDGAKIIVSNI